MSLSRFRRPSVTLLLLFAIELTLLPPLPQARVRSAGPVSPVSTRTGPGAAARLPAAPPSATTARTGARKRSAPAEATSREPRLAALAVQYDRILRATRDVAGSLAAARGSAKVVREEQSLLDSSRAELRAARAELLAKLEGIVARLDAAGRADAVARLRAFAADFTRFDEELGRDLEALAAAVPGAATAGAAGRLMQRLDALPGFARDGGKAPLSQRIGVPGPSTPGPTETLRPLPWRPIDREFREPVTESTVVPAYRGGEAQASTDSDLSETPEIRFTQEITDLAAALGNSPARIYSHVRDNFEFVPYFGSQKGSQATLETGRGNDTDLASLLLALLRVSGVPSRYVRGTVDIPAERINDWLQITDPDAANPILNTAGISAQAFLDGLGNILFYRVDRTWVEAQVPYTDYRGAGGGSGGTIWIPLDPAFKEHTPQAGIPGVAAMVPFDENGYFAAITPLLAYEWYQAQVRDWLAVNRPGDSLADIPYRGPIVSEGLQLLPASLPHEEVAFTAEYDEVADALRHKVRVKLDQGATPLIDHTLALVDIALSRLTISYRDDSGTDSLASLLDGRDNLPEFLVNVIPELKVDGVVVASGPSIASGSTVSLTVGFIEPEAGETGQATHEALTAGDYHALALDFNQIGPEYLERKGRALVAANEDVGTPAEDPDALEGELLHLTGLNYFHRVQQGNDAIVDIYRYVTVNQVHEGLVSGDTNVVYLYDRPFAVTPGNLIIDVKRQIKSQFGIDGDDSRSAEIFGIEGRNGSAQEHAIWEEMVHIVSVSSIKSIQYANENDLNGDGFPNSGDVLHFDTPGQTNQLCPGFPASVKNSQEAALSAGQQVTTPYCDHDLNDWHGVGWIEEDPASGAGAYLISGGLTGGATSVVRLNASPLGVPIGEDWAARLAACAGAGGIDVVELSGVAGLARVRGLPLPRSLRYAASALLAAGNTIQVSAGRVVCEGADGWLLRVWSEALGAWSSSLFHQGGAGTQNPPPGMPGDPGETGDPRDPCGQGGDPVNFSNGNLVEQATDVTIPLPGPDLELIRTYNSASAESGPLGPSWRHNHDVFLVEELDGSITVHDEDGGRNVFIDDDMDGTYDGPPGLGQKLVDTGPGWRLHRREGTRMDFDASGKLTALFDRNGNQLSYSYDGSGRLSTVAGLNGRSLSFGYNAGDLLVSVTDQSARTWSYTYDAAGRLATVTTPSDPDAPAQVTTYTYYDSSFIQDNLATITRPDGAEWRYVYYTNGKVHQTLEPDGRVTSMVYQPLRAATEQIDAAGALWRFTYDDFGRLVSTVNPLGEETRSVWNASGHRDSYTDSAGAATLYQYDANGNIAQVTDPEGGVVSYVYEPDFNLITSMTNPRLKTFDFIRDPVTGDMTELRDPGGSTFYTYNGQGQMLTITDPESRLTTFTYDANGYIDAVTDTSGNLTDYTYDARGNLLEMAPPAGGPTRYTYDVLDRVQTIEDPSGNVTAFDYDDMNRLVRITAPGSAVRTYERDDLGRIVRETDPLGGVTTYEWPVPACSCTTELPTAVITPDGSRWETDYDVLGRKVAERDPLGNEIRYDYDVRGFQISREAGGLLTRYEYDDVGRLTRRAHPDLSEETFQYDAAGNLEQATGPALTLSFVYDDLNRATSRTDSRLGGKTISYEYDRTGLRTRMVDADGGETLYTYDTAGRLDTLRDPLLRTYTFHYDAGSRRTRVDLPEGGAIEYGYDLNSRLTSIVHRDQANQPALSFDVGFNLRSDPVTFTDDAGTHVLTYDALGRLLSASHPDRINEFFTYDATDNRVTDMSGRTFTRDAASQLTSVGAASFQYDALGRVTQRSDTAGTTQYSYDGEGRLTQVNLPGGSVVQYGYDPLGNRTSIDVDGTPTLMVYDDLGISTRYDGAGTLLDRLVHDENVDMPLSLHRGGAAYDYRLDTLGSVAALTDSADAIRARLVYGAFGNIVSAGGDQDPIFSFTGREFDSEIGLYYYRARYYDPELGRFLARDPLGFLTGRNPYTYAANSPLRYIDPTGEILPLIVAGIVVGGLVSTLAYEGITRASGGTPTWSGRAGAFVAGGIAGGIGVVATPIAGAIGLGTGAAGTFAVNAGAGLIGYTGGFGVERLMDPCAKWSWLGFGTSGVFGGVGGWLGGKLGPTSGMRTFNQLQHFGPRTWRGVTPGFMGPNARAAVLVGTGTSAGVGAAGPLTVTTAAGN